LTAAVLVTENPAAVIHRVAVGGPGINWTNSLKIQHKAEVLVAAAAAAAVAVYLIVRCVLSLMWLLSFL